MSRTEAKTITKCAILALAVGLFSTAASAEPWADWKPVKTAIKHTYVRVEPGRLDDYLVALKKTWIPHEEFLQKQGVISRWSVQIREDQAGPGPNVTLVEWYPSRAAWDPNEPQERAEMAAARAITPKDQIPALESERGKYRTIMGETTWTEIEFPK